MGRELSLRQDKTDIRRILRSLIFLSIPTVIEHIMNTLMQYVDTAMVGRLGERATAAVSTTTTVNWLVSCVPFSVSTATLALVSKANGAKEEDDIKKYTGQSVTLTLLIGIVLTAICLVLSPYIPVWMGTESPVIGPAGEYFFIVSLSLIPRTAMYTCGASIRAVKDTKTPMIINVIANLCNVGLNYLLIYAVGMGVRGAAIATSVSYGFAGVIMLIVAYHKDVLRWSISHMRLRSRQLKQFADIGIPAVGTSAASCLGYVFFAGMVSGMGTTVFAAHSIAVTAEELFYIPGYGLRTATSSLIGNAVGEGDTRKLHITENLSIAITLSLMFISGVILFFVAYPLMSVFTSSDAVAVLGAQMLKLVAFTEPFFGLMIVIEGIYYGKGRTKGGFVAETLSMWGVRILFTFLGVRFFSFTLREVWFCMIADNICKAMMLLVLYLKQRKKESL